MQKEIKRKTMSYGLAALLLAVLLTAVVYNFGVQPYIQPHVSQVKTFTSYDELSNFLGTNMAEAKQLQQQGMFPVIYSSNLFTSAQADAVRGLPEHSTTNVQVSGVDEADFVKSDGEYLYVFSNGYIYILLAYPPEQARIVSKISLNATYGVQLYVNEGKLAVLGTHYPLYYANDRLVYPTGYASTEEAFIKVYDTSNRTKPFLTREISFNGTISGSRMIGTYVYLVLNQAAMQQTPNQLEPEVALPKILLDNTVEEIKATEIRYINVTDVSYYFTTIMAISLQNDAQDPTHETILAGTSSNMYVSENNMYLTSPNTNLWFTPLVNGVVREETLIYRVRLDNEKVLFEAQGSIKGQILNQFSMDEYNGFFRIATTTSWGTDAVNNLYVLNMNLEIVGKLEGLAPGERIYSARFMSDRVYLVTFRQVDPFFVIDLSNPTEPNVLGFLKIPGFSGYLHPYDENHIIGVGRENSNLKLSLFDVSNVAEPIERWRYVVQATGSDSSVLWDHKAFLFDKSRQLLALPVSITLPFQTGTADYYKSYWQGEYVLNLSLTTGFVLRGTITHIEDTSTNPWDSNYQVTRALYIDNVIYTVSNMKVKMNSLDSLDIINEVKLA